MHICVEELDTGKKRITMNDNENKTFNFLPLSLTYLLIKDT